MKTKSVIDGLDAKFDEGKEDILQHFDISKVQRVNEKPQRVNVDFPRWMVAVLDDEAKQLGITRQAVIKVWISDRIRSTAK